MVEAGNEERKLLTSYRCNQCGHRSSIPFEYCLKCQSSDISEEGTKETGVVESFTVQHMPGKDFMDDAPYIYVLVKLESGPVISGFIIQDDSDSKMNIGQRVRISGARGLVPTFEVY